LLEGFGDVLSDEVRLQVNELRMQASNLRPERKVTRGALNEELTRLGFSEKLKDYQTKLNETDSMQTMFQSIQMIIPGLYISAQWAASNQSEKLTLISIVIRA